MNPLTNVKNITKLNEIELSKGLTNKKSWHNMYNDSAWIFIGGLSYGLTEGDILTVFSQYGEIVNINMVRHKDTGKTRGFCFICYVNQKSTILAVDNLNGIKLCGRTIRVDHVANYRVPKDHEDDDEVTKLLRSEGCAPKLISSNETSVNLPSTSSATPIVPHIKKERKEKRRRSARSSSSSSEASSNKIAVKKEKYDPGYEKYSTASPSQSRSQKSNEKTKLSRWGDSDDKRNTTFSHPKRPRHCSKSSSDQENDLHRQYNKKGQNRNSHKDKNSHRNRKDINKLYDGDFIQRPVHNSNSSEEEKSRNHSSKSSHHKKKDDVSRYTVRSSSSSSEDEKSRNHSSKSSYGRKKDRGSKRTTVHDSESSEDEKSRNYSSKSSNGRKIDSRSKRTVHKSNSSEDEKSRNYLSKSSHCRKIDSESKRPGRNSSSSNEVEKSRNHSKTSSSFKKQDNKSRTNVRNHNSSSSSEDEMSRNHSGISSHQQKIEDESKYRKQYDILEKNYKTKESSHKKSHSQPYDNKSYKKKKSSKHDR